MHQSFINPAAAHGLYAIQTADPGKVFTISIEAYQSLGLVLM
jgi:hypothetical protein